MAPYPNTPSYGSVYHNPPQPGPLSSATQIVGHSDGYQQSQSNNFAQFAFGEPPGLPAAGALQYNTGNSALAPGTGGSNTWNHFQNSALPPPQYAPFSMTTPNYIPPPVPSMQNAPFQSSALQFSYPPSSTLPSHGSQSNYFASESHPGRTRQTEREDGEVSEPVIPSGLGNPYHSRHKFHIYDLGDVQQSQPNNHYDAGSLKVLRSSQPRERSPPNTRNIAMQPIAHISNATMKAPGPPKSQTRPPRRNSFQGRASTSGHKQTSAKSSLKNTKSVPEKRGPADHSPYRTNIRSGSNSPAVTHQNGSPKQEKHKSSGEQNSGEIPFPKAVTTEAAAKEFISEQRNSAKQFILCIHKHRYTYDQLVQFDLDPSILKSIYDELGIPVTNANTDSPATAQSKPSLVAESNSLKLDSYPSLPESNSVPQIQPTSTVSVPAERRVSPINSLEVAESGENPKMERKDLIARLMAAKAKKQTTALSVPQSQDTGTAKAGGPLANSKPIAEIQNNHIQHNKHQNNAPNNNDPSPEEKRKAQTELARRRIEELGLARKALASKATLSVQAPGSTHDTGNSKSTSVATSLDLPATASESAESGVNGMTEIFESDSAQSPPTFINGTPSDFKSRISIRKGSEQPEQDFDDRGFGIPGLFETSPAPWSKNVNIESIPQMKNLHDPGTTDFNNERNPTRKRPVAADFDLEPVRFITKRPFGHDRYAEDSEDMIIEVSEDDSEEEARDLDDAREERDMSSASTGSVRQPIVIRDTPTVTDYRQKASFNSSSNVSGSGPGTPASFQNSAFQRDAGWLKKREEEIIAMKKKIAEAELKRKSKITNSGAHTPATSQQTLPKLHDPVPLQSSEHRKDNTIESLSHKISEQQPESGSNIRVSATISQDFELAIKSKDQNQILLSTPSDPGPLLNSTIGWKRRRRAEIKSGLPALEASFTRKRSKLEELRIQVLELESSLQNEKESKQRLMDELESLGIDTDGMDHEELQATKDDIVAQAEVQRNIASPKTSPDNEIREASINSYNSSVSMNTSENETESLQSLEASLSETGPALPHSENDRNQILHSATYAKDSEENDKADELFIEAGQTSSSASVSLLEKPMEFRNVTEEVFSSSAEEMEMDEVSSSESGEITSEHEATVQNRASPEPEQTLANDTKSSPAEKQLVEMSNTASSSEVSEDYEPLDPLISMPENDAMADEDIYEPPKVASSNSNTYAQVNGSPPIVSPPTGVLPGAPLSSKQLPRLLADESSTSATPSHQLEKTLPSDGKNAQAAPLPISRNRFTPYESPLKQFKAYRFHPEFEKNISGGFRSISYTHNINSDTPLCEFEIAGGTCNDNTCSSQHFRSMVVDGEPDFSRLQVGGIGGLTRTFLTFTDSTILIQLGTTNPGRTDEEKARWTEGLRRTLNELKESGNETPESVAASISAYRRVFFNDPTRILDI